MDVLTAQSAPSLVRARPELGVAVRLATAVMAGCAWGGPDALLAFVPFVFAAYWHARSRLEAGLVVWTYHVVAARSLVVGGARLLGVPLIESALLVGACAAVLSLVWTACWARPSNRSVWQTALRTAVLLLVTILPPLGALAVPHPLSVAGLWFPGWGFAGLACMAIAAGAMCSVRCGVVPCAVVAVVAVARGAVPQPAVPLEIEAIQTHYGASRNDVGDFVRQWWVAHDAMQRLGESRAPLLVLPEGTGGLWSAPMQEQWAGADRALRARDQTALVGVTTGSVVEPLSAGVVALGATRAYYRQRVAMPIAVWRPGSSAFAPDWFGPGTLDVSAAGTHVRVGVLICWEIGVIWSVLRSVAEGAAVLVVVANTAWLEGTTGGRVQAQMLSSWGALFGLPVRLSTNS